MSTEPNPESMSAEASAPTAPEAEVSTVNLLTGEAVNAESDEENAEPEPLTPEQMDRYECRSCGYTYEPVKGDNQSKIPAGIPFEELDAEWRCPVCGARKPQFSNVGPQGTASGFKENLNYGLGVNAMTPGQKNILIFGSMAIAIAFFLSLYGLR